MEAQRRAEAKLEEAEARVQNSKRSKRAKQRRARPRRRLRRPQPRRGRPRSACLTGRLGGGVKGAAQLCTGYRRAQHRARTEMAEMLAMAAAMKAQLAHAEARRLPLMRRRPPRAWASVTVRRSSSPDEKQEFATTHGGAASRSAACERWSYSAGLFTTGRTRKHTKGLGLTCPRE